MRTEAKGKITETKPVAVTTITTTLVDEKDKAHPIEDGTAKALGLIKTPLRAQNTKAAMKIYQYTQKELKEYLQRFLVSQGYEPVSADGFLYAAGEIPVLLVAHMDTVHYAVPSTICRGGSDGSIWMSPQGIGGDDRNGVYMITEIIKDLRCHVLFCEDEETGGIGARKFTKSDIRPDVNHIIEFDRNGTNDAVFYSCDNKDYVKFIESFGFKEAYGSFSDISTIAPHLGIAAVNLSSGYYNPHMRYEYVSFNVMHNNMIRAMGIILSSDARFLYVKKEYSYKSYVYDDKYSTSASYYKNHTSKGTKALAQQHQTNWYGAGRGVDPYDDDDDDDLLSVGKMIAPAWCIAESLSEPLVKKLEKLSLLPPGATYAREDILALKPSATPSVMSTEEEEEDDDDRLPIIPFQDKYRLVPGLGGYSAKEQHDSVYMEQLCMLPEGGYIITDDGTLVDESEYMFMIDAKKNVYLMESTLCMGADGVLIDASPHVCNSTVSPPFDIQAAEQFAVSDLYCVYDHEVSKINEQQEPEGGNPNGFTSEDEEDDRYVKMFMEKYQEAQTAGMRLASDADDYNLSLPPS